MHIKDAEDGKGSNSNAYRKQELINFHVKNLLKEIKLLEYRSCNLLSKHKEVQTKLGSHPWKSYDL